MFKVPFILGCNWQLQMLRPFDNQTTCRGILRVQGHFLLLISRKNSVLCRSRFSSPPLKSEKVELEWGWDESAGNSSCVPSDRVPHLGCRVPACVRALAWIRLTVGRGWILPENKSLYCSCLLMHCLLGAWFVLLQEAEPLAPNEFFVKHQSLPEIFTLFSSSLSPGSNVQYCRGLAPGKQMTFFC